ncbi:DNA alkylation repair protein [Oscillospiraceae bacterium OttesenSCG-928-G22]|nr:DNA alkylation repair protein [Christensenellaceae bacterium OttesenSCG-928-M15]MDL2274025.1 DNA alkylation repair protein [Oscillospiraceae bacterium OttesenSCG-928-G22]
MSEYIEYLSETIPEKDSLKLVRKEAEQFYKTHCAEECHKAIMPLYESDNFQIQEVGVFLCGYIGKEYPDTIQFLRDTVSKHESWKVQEILAMAFDIHCKTIGYENALPLIKEWLASDTANVRRAVSEGLRAWTSRPYFKEHPDVAISLLAAHQSDESEYVRKSIGNALRDISKNYPELVKNELGKWDLSLKQVKQVHRLASAWILKQG